MRRWLKFIVAFLAALAICYVLVSPLVPTPKALCNSQTLLIVFIVPFLVVPVIVFVIAHSGLREEPFNPVCPDVVALTCSRLC